MDFEELLAVAIAGFVAGIILGVIQTNFPSSGVSGV